MKIRYGLLFCYLLCGLTVPVAGQWLDFNDASATWLASLGTDNEEKDLATGDLNKDGLMDVVVVRKTPFSEQGSRADLLLINTGTSLEDQTATYAPQFLTRLTDARDVVIADFDGDTWLDVVIGSTFEDQPVYYRNLGEGGGNWFGLVDESASRLPLPLNVSPLQFCALWAGDVSGDGVPDIYFSNYDPNGSSQDVLLINNGNGVFTDESDSRLGTLRNSAFGTSAEIHDVDLDGDNDIIKISTLFAVAPFNEVGVFVLYNNGDGTFTNWENLASGGQPYMFTTDHIDNDAFKDIYIVDDNQDFYHLVTGATPNTALTYSTSNSTDPRTQAFGGNCKFSDLDNDGWLDFGIADVDVDIPPCNSGTSLRKFSLMHNDAGTLDPVYGSTNYPWNVSTYDFAFLDANNDGLMDFLLGVCDGYKLFLQESGCDLTIDLPSDTSNCQIQLIELDAGAGFATYLWNTGATTQIITPSASGMYCVTVTDVDGCTANTCTNLTVLPIPSLEITGPTEVCNGGIFLLNAESTSVIDTYQWSHGPNSNPAPISSPGTYCVTITDEAGCTNVGCVELELSPDLEPEIMGHPVICGGSPASLFVSSSYSAATWTSGQNALSILASVPGEYCVTVTDMNGCTGDTCIAVTAVDGLNITVSGQGTICRGESAMICADVGNGAFQFDWFDGQAGPCIQVDTTGTYCVIVTDDNGCTDEACISIEVIDIPVPVVTMPEIYCANDSAFLSVSQDYINYSWSTGDTDTSGIWVTSSGDYSLTVADAFGCTAIVDTTLRKYFDLGPDVNICEGDVHVVEWSDSMQVQMFEFSAPGTYIHTVTDSLGNSCSDDITINVIPSKMTVLTVEICEGEIVDLDSLGAGVFTGANGCDSIVTVSLVELPGSINTITELVCFGDTLPIPSIDTLADQNSCDSIVITEYANASEIQLTEVLIVPDQSIGTGRITIDPEGGAGDFTYQWSTGDTTHAVSGLSRGTYVVTVTDGDGCTAVFDAFVPLDITRPDYDPRDIPTIYPNPSSGSFNFEQGSNPILLTDELHVIDIFGRTIKVIAIDREGPTFFTINAASGVYFALAITDGEVRHSTRLIVSD